MTSFTVKPFDQRVVQIFSEQGTSHGAPGNAKTAWNMTSVARNADAEEENDDPDNSGAASSPATAEPTV